MPPTVFSLFPRNDGLERELISTVLTGRGFRLEHIVSNAAASPDGFWYDQDRNEWVVLIQGAATLEFPDGPLDLRAGDCLLIEAHQRHRVSFTSQDAVWIALHFDADSSVEPDS
ncbi:MAG: cupin domain-containing protein [Verrucomicrobiaceae bacterium]|nr:MAG: cupin domain-containing protein [Verrucomicrobiaceae bacterium]